MNNKKKLKKHPNWGQAPKYKGEEHTKLLIEMFRSGEGVGAFCDEADIGETTFYNWLNMHPKFKEAYQIALSKGKRYWERLPFEGKPDFNHASWHLIMKNRFGYGRFRMRKSTDNTAISKMHSLWEGMEEGEFTPEEVSKIAGAAVDQSTIENNGNSVQAMALITETRESLADRIMAADRLLAHLEKEPADETKKEFEPGIKGMTKGGVAIGGKGISRD